MLKRFVCFALLLMLALPAAAEVIDLPIEAGPGLEYNWDNYLSKTEYQDPSLHVQVFEGGRIHDTNYLYAIVKIASPTQLRTAMAYKYNSKYTVIGEKMAEANNAVIAVNGDYFNYNSHGYLVRQGVEYRNRPNKAWDILIIDQHGDFHTIVEPSKKKLEQWKTEHPDLQIINTFNFGPVFIQDGQPRTDKFSKVENYFQIAGHREYARMCICQLDTLTYMLVSCESVLDKESTGMTLDEFMDCLREIDEKVTDYDIRVAYNIDGGGSATMVFAEEKINSLTNPKVRDLCDIIYFASAWQE